MIMIQCKNYHNFCAKKNPTTNTLKWNSGVSQLSLFHNIESDNEAGVSKATITSSYSNGVTSCSRIKLKQLLEQFVSSKQKRVKIKLNFPQEGGVGGEGYWRRTEGVSYQIADMAQMLADNTVKFLLDRPHTKESKPHKQQTEKLKELLLPFPLFTFPI